MVEVNIVSPLKVHVLLLAGKGARRVRHKVEEYKAVIRIINEELLGVETTLVLDRVEVEQLKPILDAWLERTAQYVGTVATERES